MPKYNADTVYEPIEIIMGGKTYVIKKVTQAMLEASGQLDGKTGEAAMDGLLSIYLGVPESEFAGGDIRQKRGALEFLTKTLQEQLGVPQGNAPEAAVKPIG